MKKLIIGAVAIVLGILMILVFTQRISVAEGEEAVLVKKPWFFGEEGVVETPATTGLVWAAVTTDYKLVNIKPFNHDEVFVDLITIDNNPIDFKIHMTFKHIEGETPVLVEDFGLNMAWYRNKVREPLRNTVRNYTKGRKMFEMTTDPKYTIELEKLVTKTISDFLRAEKIPTELVRSTIGKVYAPEEIIEETIQTGKQKQRAKTEKERANAELARKESQTNKALADKAYAKTFGMTPEQYLRMKKLNNEAFAIQTAAEGKVNLTVIMGGDPKPMFNVPTGSK